MIKMQNWLVAAGIAAALCAGAGNSLAQQDNGGGAGNGRRGGFGGDPAQFRQRMVERYKEDLEVTKDDEWQALQPRIEKVMEARFASMAGMGRGMFGRRGGPGGPGGPGGDNAQGAAGAQGGQRRGPFGQEALPEADALQKAIDAKASGAELKATLTKFTTARKAKEEQLKAAQEDLRKLLTPRQEAIATLNGLL